MSTRLTSVLAVLSAALFVVVASLSGCQAAAGAAAAMATAAKCYTVCDAQVKGTGCTLSADYANNCKTLCDASAVTAATSCGAQANAMWTCQQGLKWQCAGSAPGTPLPTDATTCAAVEKTYADCVATIVKK